MRKFSIVILCVFSMFCLSPLGVEASETENQCPTLADMGFDDLTLEYPYYIVTKTSGKYSGKGTCNGDKYKVFLSKNPFVAFVHSGDNVGITVDDGDRIYLMYYLDPTVSYPRWKVLEVGNGGGQSFNKKELVKTSHTVYDREENEVFQKPQAPEKPAVGLGEEWWTAVLNRIIPNAPVILMAVLLILFLAFLMMLVRRSVKSSTV